tara:strand:- start:4251 stop:4664 length:414 start_codon:yes stop_codon:yes gene_type:complete
MYEVTTQELAVFAVLGFVGGVFMSFYLTRFMEVVHMHRIFREVLVHLLLMCVGIIEDVEFLKELKRKQMAEAGFSKKQVAEFEEVAEHTLTNWKDSVIQSLVSKAPRPFKTMMPFGNWKEAVAFLERDLGALRERKN